MEQFVNLVIRPPRAEYDPETDLLYEEFMLKGKFYRRNDMEVTNNRGEVLKCSHYVPVVDDQVKPLPCVIFCHGNRGCRIDAGEAAIVLLPSNITVFTFDFAGSGLSGGEHVTLGWNEKDDLKAVVNYLRADENVSLIGLWGRSMGAVASLMYGAEDPLIAGMVLDSPFADLVGLMMELVDTHKYLLPKFTVKFAIQCIRRVILKRTNFDIMELNVIKVAKACFIPVLIGHATDDDFVHPHHSDRIFEAYVGDKKIIKIGGDHNSPRPQFYFDSINIFFRNVLQPPEDELTGSFFQTTPDFLGEDVETDDDCGASSARMVDCQLLDGPPCGPHVLTSKNDGQRPEYELNDLKGFPCDAEEEDMMSMQDVTEALHDRETHRPGADEAHLADSSTSICKSSHADDLESSINTDSSEALETESSCPSFARATSEVKHPSPGTSMSSALREEVTDASAASEKVSIASHADSTMSIHMTARMMRGKDPASHIIDGLKYRWDLCFHSSSGRN